MSRSCYSVRESNTLLSFPRCSGCFLDKPFYNITLYRRCVFTFWTGHLTKMWKNFTYWECQNEERWNYLWHWWKKLCLLCKEEIHKKNYLDEICVSFKRLIFVCVCAQYMFVLLKNQIYVFLSRSYTVWISHFFPHLLYFRAGLEFVK